MSHSGTFPAVTPVEKLLALYNVCVLSRHHVEKARCSKRHRDRIGAQTVPAAAGGREKGK